MFRFITARPNILNIKYLLLALLILVVLSAPAQERKSADISFRPNLVVGIVVDQMRWDYLYRFYDRYQEGGFKRMLKEGFACENTYINYIPTVTAVGHSTIYTGSVPAIHGIAGNNFIDQNTGREMYCAEDTTVQTIGSPSHAGKMSPRNLLTTTIGDELKLATNFQSKVMGIALKDRGAILPAGHSADAAYWFDDSTGTWISSSYYMEELPGWVKLFNKQKLAEKYLKQDWKTLYDIETYVQSSPDKNRYEGMFSDSDSPVFPIKTSEMYDKNYNIIRTTPYGNSITVDMAKAAIINEQLGQNEVTDFLAISFSSTDYIGHKFGVNAIEVEDTYLRLDKELADFFEFMDRKIGQGNYTVFLTADHAAAHNPAFLLDHKIPAGLWPRDKLLKDLNDQLEATYKFKNLALSFLNYQVHLNNTIIENKGLNEEDIRRDCIQFLRDQEGVAFVIDMDKVRNASIPDVLQSRILNGHHPERSGAIQIILKPAWLSGSATGTTHSAWYAYDAHIPLIWMGWGVKHGYTHKPVYMTDIAATLAALLYIQVPNGSVGQPIEVLLIR